MGSESEVSPQMRATVGLTTISEYKSPPPVIGSDRVIAYAIVDKSVTFTNKQRLFVGDKLLGPVPRIAICRSLRKELKDYLILYCDKKWEVLGVSGATSLALAKNEVERYYRGISAKWTAVNNYERAARKWPNSIQMMYVVSAASCFLKSIQ